MRKFKKDIIIDLTKSLREANEKLIWLINAKEYTEAFSILEVCQQGALSIGTSIEGSENSSEEIIPELEAYCDDIYLIGSNLSNTDYDFYSVFISIDRRLNFIEDFVKNKIKVHYEIVFLPYNASMWDSMESVWKAASQDPNCSCYVMPIPYYEKTSDKAVMKYEGELFPKYVPITDYNDYNIKDRLPDIIYIHNPFDQYNRVTSVHPAFFSFELKKYTQMLVYIPYFITGGSVPEVFRNLPSYKYIDKIIIQSPSQAHLYENISSEKLVSLGSPKVDRVISLINGHKDYPEEWKSIIKNKRVIFYNTSLSGLLKYKEKALDKMEYIFSCFKNRKTEALLWRPHPLTKATLRSMIPQMYQRYCELEQKFITDAIGIYDTTSDVSTSVALSDAYIGEEGSSIVHLFGVTGKPIFLMDIKLSTDLDQVRRNLVGCMDACVSDGNLWFMHCHYNALCKMELTTGKVEIVGAVPDEISNGERLYHDVIKKDEKLFFAPHIASRLIEFDLNKKTYREISIKHAIQKEKSKFTRMIRYKDRLFLLPTYYQAVVGYNCNNGSTKYYTHLIRAMKGHNKEPNNQPEFMNAMTIEGELLLMASSRTNAILEFNIETEKSILHIVGNDSNNYYRMEYDGNDYWLIPHNSKAIVRWNRKNGKCTEYLDYPEGFIGDNNAFLSIHYCGDYMLAFPKKANMIIKIDIQTGCMAEFKLPLPFKEGDREEKYYNWPNNYYFTKKIDDDHIIALTAYNSSLLIINTKTQECTIRKCFINSRAALLKFCHHGDNLPNVLMESSVISLDDFLYEVEENKIFNSEAQKKAYETIISNMDGICGSKVHCYITKQFRNMANSDGE